MFLPIKIAFGVQDTPSNPRQFIGKRDAKLVVLHACRSGFEPCTKTELGPVLWSHHYDLCGLHKEHAQIPIASLCDASQGGAPTCVVLMWHKPQRHARGVLSARRRKIATTIISFALSDSGYHGS